MSYYVKNPEVPNTYIQVGTDKYNDLLDRGVIDESVPKFKYNTSNKRRSTKELNDLPTIFEDPSLDKNVIYDTITDANNEEIQVIFNSIKFPLSITCPKEGTIGTLNTDYTFYYKDKTGVHSLLVSPDDNKLEVFSYNSSWITGFFYNNNYCQPKRLFIKKIDEERDIIDGDNCMLVSHNGPRYPGFIKKYNSKNNYHYINIIIAILTIITTAYNPTASMNLLWTVFLTFYNYGWITGAFFIKIIEIYISILVFQSQTQIRIDTYTSIINWFRKKLKNGGYI